MRDRLRTWGCGAALLAGLVLPAVALAQPPRNGVNPVIINNGTRTTVRYVLSKDATLSPGEVAGLRDLERAINDASYAENLQDLKRQYVADERKLEARRRAAQEWLYGASMTPLYGGGMAAMGYTGDWGALGWGGGYYNSVLGYPYGYGGYSSLGGYGGFGGSTSSRAVAASMADPEEIKVAMSGVIARESTSDYAVAAARNLDRAVAAAGSSPTLRASLGLPESKDGRAYDRITPVVTGPSGPVVVTLKDGTRIVGNKLEEKGDWIIITVTKTRTERIRLSEVTRVQQDTSAVPAGG